VSSSGLPNLAGIDWDTIAITDEALRAFAEAVRHGHLSQLEVLILQLANTQKDAIDALFEAAMHVGWTELEMLSLEGAAALTDSHVEALTNLIAKRGLPKLRMLSLSKSGIGDRSVKAIVQVAERGYLKSLQSLCLRGTNITNESLKELAKSAARGNFRSLERLHLDQTNVSIVDYALLTGGNAAAIFKAVNRGMPLRLARIAFVGTGGAGKSSLFRRVFLNELTIPGEPNETVDIELVRPEALKWKPVVKFDGDNAEAIETQIWDFGGQWILHGLHEQYITPDRRTI
jgi:hypothetical protein